MRINAGVDESTCPSPTTHAYQLLIVASGFKFGSVYCATSGNIWYTHMVCHKHDKMKKICWKKNQEVKSEFPYLYNAQ